METEKLNLPEPKSSVPARVRMYSGVFVLCLLLLVVAAAWAQEETRVSIYTPQTAYSLPVVTRAGAEYAGLLEVLEPMGAVSAKQDRNQWKLRFNNSVDAQFTEGKARVELAGQNFDLGAGFLIENGRGLVPLHALPALVQRITGFSVEFHESARRLFVGHPELRTVTSAQLSPGRLILTFSAPVYPSVVGEPGNTARAGEESRLRMVFVRDPLVIAPDTPLAGAASTAGAGGIGWKLDDTLITGAHFTEANGASASFSRDHRTLTITAQVAPAHPASAGSQPRPVPALPPQAAPAPALLVVLDPAHGGTDAGATLSKHVLEKDLTLAFARRLHHELELRGIVPRLLRDTDTTLALEERAASANAALLSARPLNAAGSEQKAKSELPGVTAAVFLAIHAGGPGSGVRVFTSTLAPARTSSAFLPWETAQSAFVAESEMLATRIATELLKRDIPAVSLSASVRPLDNIAGPALALEIAPPNGGKLDDLASPKYQQSICAAIAEALTAIRAHPAH
jgi:N-acetylmuramoyl-L-alanine amidase